VLVCLIFARDSRYC